MWTCEFVFGLVSLYLDGCDKQKRRRKKNMMTCRVAVQLKINKFKVNKIDNTAHPSQEGAALQGDGGVAGEGGEDGGGPGGEQQPDGEGVGRARRHCQQVPAPQQRPDSQPAGQAARQLQASAAAHSLTTVSPAAGSCGDRGRSGRGRGSGPSSRLEQGDSGPHTAAQAALLTPTTCCWPAARPAKVKKAAAGSVLSLLTSLHRPTANTKTHQSVKIVL